MFAVIFLTAERGAGRLTIAGRPLLARQLEWLRESGCERVAVEVGPDADGDALGEWLSRGDAIGLDADVVLTRGGVGPFEVAKRAGWPSERMFAAVPNDVLGFGDLALLTAKVASRRHAIARLRPLASVPKGPLLPYVRIGSIESGPTVPAVVATELCGVRLRSAEAAHRVGCVALENARGGQDFPGSRLQIHGAEHAPSIWIARGARVSRQAKLIAPLYVGPDAVIDANAVVGPAVDLGARVVVEREAAIANAVVDRDVIIGSYVSIRDAHVRSTALRTFNRPDEVRISNPMMLDARTAHAHSSPVARILGAAAFVTWGTLVLPSVVVRSLLGGRWFRRIAPTRLSPDKSLTVGTTGIRALDVLPELFDVMLGERTFLGIRHETSRLSLAPLQLASAAVAAPYGVIDVEPALLPTKADLQSKLMARAWYGANKSLRNDLRTFVRLLQRMFAR